MRDIKKLIIVAATLMFGTAMAVPALVYAHEDESNSIASNNGGSSETENTVKSKAHNKEEIKARVAELKAQFKKTAQEKNQQTKAEVKEKSAEARKNACEARKDSIEKRLANRVEKAKAHKATFDKVFARVKAFHDEKNLNTPNYDSLVAAADAAAAEAEAQINALDALDGSVDCSQSTVTDSLAAFKEAVTGAKQSLKDYRTAIKNLIVAVHQSAEQSESSSN